MPKKVIHISPLVKSISGKIKLPPDFDYKKEYSNYLERKYKTSKRKVRKETARKER